MALHQITRSEAYVRYLQENPQEQELLFREFLIGVTEFFRDAAAWEALRDADAASTLAEVLTLDGHKVEVALDGRSGIDLVRRIRPDFVLCDIGLPDLSGYEVASALRADETLRATRLVALSGYAQPEDRERAREAGFEAHLPKPPDLDAMNALFAKDA